MGVDKTARLPALCTAKGRRSRGESKEEAKGKGREGRKEKKEERRERGPHNTHTRARRPKLGGWLAAGGGGTRLSLSLLLSFNRAFLPVLCPLSHRTSLIRQQRSSLVSFRDKPLQGSSIGLITSEGKHPTGEANPCCHMHKHFLGSSPSLSPRLVSSCRRVGGGGRLHHHQPTTWRIPREGGKGGRETLSWDLYHHNSLLVLPRVTEEGRRNNRPLGNVAPNPLSPCW